MLFQSLGVGHVFRAYGEYLLVVVGTRLRHIVLLTILISREPGRLCLAPQLHGVVETHAQTAFIAPRHAGTNRVRQVVAFAGHERVGRAYHSVGKHILLVIKRIGSDVMPQTVGKAQCERIVFVQRTFVLQTEIRLEGAYLRVVDLLCGTDGCVAIFRCHRVVEIAPKITDVCTD